MADIEKTLKISAPVTPYSTLDKYPTHYSIFGKGGLKSVANLQERNNIPEERREEGMMVYVVNMKKVYGLQNGITNSDWVDATILIGGENAGHIIVSISEPEDPSAGTLWLQPEEGNLYYRDIGNTHWLQYVPPLVDGGEF